MTGSNIWVVVATEKDPENGAFIISKTPDYVYDTFGLALTEAKEIFNQLLAEYELPNNNACTEDGCSVPGGCGLLVDANSETAEATIWDFLECEDNALTERAVITVTKKAIMVGRCESCGEEIPMDAVSMEYDNKLYHEECFSNAAHKLLVHHEKAEDNKI